MKKKVKVLALLSGGLDSILAAKVLLEQKIEVTGLIFKSCFFDEQKGIKAAKQLKIPSLVIDFSDEHLAMVKKPKYGYGTAANPCLDCHLLMLKIAKSFLKNQRCKRNPPARWISLAPGNFKQNINDKNYVNYKFDFVATGEVLGQRPFSQNKKSLEILAEESGLDGYLLRPLSAQLLPTTIPEKKGWVDRKNLLAIQGRNRQQQIELAKKWRLTYPQPAGGCILCEKIFGEKLKTMFKTWPDCNGDDIQLLKFGRHFWSGKNLIVLGRNKIENEKLEKMTNKKDILVIPKNFPGPTALVRGKKISQDLVQKAKETTLKFSPKVEKRKIKSFLPFPV